MQYISDAYSEILGRMDSQGFQFWSNLLHTSPNANTLRNIGSSFFLSDEFTTKNYSNPEKLTALYRFALNREADIGGFWHYWQALENGLAFASVVSQFFNSAEFNANVSRFLSLTYDFNPALKPLAYGKPGEGLRFADTIALQNYLNTATGIVELAQSQTIEVKSMVFIPDGVMLKTHGSPDPSEYLRQVRFWRSRDFNDGAMFAVSGGIESVWVDGQRNISSTNYKPQNLNIATWQGSNIQIINNRSDNPQGFTGIALAPGSTETSNAIIRGNFIDLSASNHQKYWADGISVSHKKGVIEGNTIVNATDVAIVLFASPVFGAQSQNSIVRNNRIYQTSRSAFGGLVLDGVFSDVGSKPFQSGADAYLSQFTGNYLFTAKRTTIDIGIAVGTRTWYGGMNGQTVRGGMVSGNYSDVPLRVATGIFVSGALDVTMGSNSLVLEFAPEANSKIPRAPRIASLSGGYASFTNFQTVSWVDADMPGVILQK